jgi:hypothetical protein
MVEVDSGPETLYTITWPTPKNSFLWFITKTFVLLSYSGKTFSSTTKLFWFNILISHIKIFHIVPKF